MSFSRKTTTTTTSYSNKGSPLSAGLATRSLMGEQRTRTMSEYSNSRSVTPAVVESRTVIQKEEWLEVARRSTEHFKNHGSPVPLVWVWPIFTYCDLRLTRNPSRF